MSKFSAIFIPGLLLVSGCMNAERVLKDMPDGMRHSYARININDDELHYGSHEDGHFHPDNREICVTSEVWNYFPDLLWHEIAHAYYDKLCREGSDFADKWHEIGGGYMTRYGREKESEIEDIAEAVRLVYREYWGIKTEWHDFSLHMFLGSYEPYAKKLKLLPQYGFCAENVYRFCIGNLKKAYWNRREHR